MQQVLVPPKSFVPAVSRSRRVFIDSLVSPPLLHARRTIIRHRRPQKPRAQATAKLGRRVENASRAASASARRLRRLDGRPAHARAAASACARELGDDAGRVPAMVAAMPARDARSIADGRRVLALGPRDRALRRTSTVTARSQELKRQGRRRRGRMTAGLQRRIAACLRRLRRYCESIRT